jgi:hypothetical protein
MTEHITENNIEDFAYAFFCLFCWKIEAGESGQE